MATSLYVPAIDKRKRISEDTISKVTEMIVSGFKPDRVILFGSYADGTFKPESDLDVLIIMKTSIREVEQAQIIRKHINPLFGIDLIVHTPENLSKRLELGDSFLSEIISNGRILYESSDA